MLGQGAIPLDLLERKELFVTHAVEMLLSGAQTDFPVVDGGGRLRGRVGGQ